MKRPKNIRMLSISLLLLGSIICQGQTIKDKKGQQFDDLTKLIESKTFTFEADRAFPSSGNSVDLFSNPNYLKIDNDTAEADLPFFGRAYSVEYGGEGGIKFNGKMENYEEEINPKKRSISLSFTVKNGNDTFKIGMELFHSKSASVNIVSNNRSSISYSGKVTTAPNDKK